MLSFKCFKVHRETTYLFSLYLFISLGTPSFILAASHSRSHYLIARGPAEELRKPDAPSKFLTSLQTISIKINNALPNPGTVIGRLIDVSNDPTTPTTKLLAIQTNLEAMADPRALQAVKSIIPSGSQIAILEELSQKVPRGEDPQADSFHAMLERLRRSFISPGEGGADSKARTLESLGILFDGKAGVPTAIDANEFVANETKSKYKHLGDNGVELYFDTGRLMRRVHFQKEVVKGTIFKSKIFPMYVRVWNRDEALRIFTDFVNYCSKYPGQSPVVNTYEQEGVHLSMRNASGLMAHVFTGSQLDPATGSNNNFTAATALGLSTPQPKDRLMRISIYKPKVFDIFLRALAQHGGLQVLAVPGSETPSNGSNSSGNRTTRPSEL